MFNFYRILSLSAFFLDPHFLFGIFLLTWISLGTRFMNALPVDLATHSLINPQLVHAIPNRLKFIPKLSSTRTTNPGICPSRTSL